MASTLASPGSGERFIQPRVANAAGGEGLLDDVAGGGLRLLSTDLDLLAPPHPACGAGWRGLAGQAC